MRRLLVLALLVTACGGRGTLNHLSTEPGEEARYEMNRGRTSSLVRDASAKATIMHATEIGWLVRLDYRVRIPLRTEDGAIEKDIEREFFTEAYREELRRDGVKQHREFKVTHRGYDGRCDDVTISDMADTDPVDDLTIDAHICPGVPVLGAETLDMKGRYAGQNVRLGLDWEGL